MGRCSTAACFAFSLAVATSWLGWSNAQDRPTPKDKIDQPRTPKFTPDFVLTADQMIREYIADPKAANTKYEGKVVEVTGEVDYISPGRISWAGRMLVTLKGIKKNEKDRLEHGLCASVLPKDETKVSRLSKGQKVKVVGVCSEWSGYWLGLFPCDVTEVEPTKILVTTAKQIAEDFERDAKASAEKYPSDQDIIVSCTVEDVIVNGDAIGGADANIGGTKSTKVFVSLSFKDYNNLYPPKMQQVDFRVRGGFRLDGKEIRCSGFVIDK